MKVGLIAGMNRCFLLLADPLFKLKLEGAMQTHHAEKHVKHLCG